jgi:hypothetical protein
MRTAGSISMGSSMPAAGKYACQVISVEKGTSSKSNTPFIEPMFTTGEDDFSDQLYVTPKTLGRLLLFAKKVCGMQDSFELPDDDMEASKSVANFIMKNALGKQCFVTIEEIEEKFMPSTGPDAGRTIIQKKRKVAFRGYDRYGEEIKRQSVDQKDEDLPF